MEKLKIEPFETVVPYALGDVHRVSKTSHLWLDITLTHVNGF